MVLSYGNEGVYLAQLFQKQRLLKPFLLQGRTVLSTQNNHSNGNPTSTPFHKVATARLGNCSLFNVFKVRWLHDRPHRWFSKKIKLFLKCTYCSFSISYNTIIEHLSLHNLMGHSFIYQGAVWIWTKMYELYKCMFGFWPCTLAISSHHKDNSESLWQICTDSAVKNTGKEGNHESPWYRKAQSMVTIQPWTEIWPLRPDRKTTSSPTINRELQLFKAGCDGVCNPSSTAVR